MEKALLTSLQQTAAKCRLNILRMLRAGGSGHLGGAMSCMDIVTALYFHTMHIDPSNPKMQGRDRFLLSAGHKCMAQYAALAERGYFNKAVLDTYGSLHAKIPGHPDMYKLPGVEANTGALGHGLSIAVGMALGMKVDKTSSRVFVVMGDGELPEGSNWEAAAAAGHHQVDNLVVFVDCNGMQISGHTKEVMNMEPIGDKFKAFGFDVREIDGNDMQQIVEALDATPFTAGKPSMIIARTVKGKGVSFAENSVPHHYWKASESELQLAESDLRAYIEQLASNVQ